MPTVAGSTDLTPVVILAVLLVAGLLIRRAIRKDLWPADDA